MDADAKKLCRSCHGCQAVSEYAPPEPMARAFPPSGPCKDCAADILGPLPSGESLLVVVDYFSRYFEAVSLRSTYSTRIIEGLKPIFARFGGQWGGRASESHIDEGGLDSPHRRKRLASRVVDISHRI